MKRRTPNILAVLGGVVAVFTMPLSSQTPIPIASTSGISFTASADHNALNADGTPMLDHYQVNVFAQNDLGAIAYTQGLGKPTPDATNTITVKPLSVFSTIARNQIYIAAVSAVGPGGATTSPISDPFVAPAAAVAPRPPVSKPTILP